jgi:hypothetical protein
LELLYVVVHKTDKGGIAGTNNSHLFFAHKLFEFSHDYLNILICGEAHHQSRTIYFQHPPHLHVETTILDYVHLKDETVCRLWASSS